MSKIIRNLAVMLFLGVGSYLVNAQAFTAQCKVFMYTRPGM